MKSPVEDDLPSRAVLRALPDRIRHRLAPSGTDKLVYRVGLRSAGSLALPDFLGIGAQKAGTTWLHTNLAHHPDLFLPRERKELHYFDENWAQPLASYAAHFADAGDRVKGEITPAYGILPVRRIRFIRHVMPELKLILLLRDPIERAWSQAYMNLVQGPGVDLANVTDEAFIAHFRSEGSMQRGDYLRTIDRWTSIFPAKRLLVGFYEEIRDSPEALLQRVFAHLGVRAVVDWDVFPVRKKILPEQAPSRAPQIPANLDSYLRELYRDDSTRLSDRFGSFARGWTG